VEADVIVSLEQFVQAMIGGATVWFGGKLFGGGDKAKKVYKYHR